MAHLLGIPSLRCVEWFSQDVIQKIQFIEDNKRIIFSEDEVSYIFSSMFNS